MMQQASLWPPGPPQTLSEVAAEVEMEEATDSEMEEAGSGGERIVPSSNQCIVFRTITF